MILLDLNALLDVIQQREPYYRASAAVVGEVIEGKWTAALPAHAVTTLHYIVGRYRDREAADGVVDWLLRHFSVAGVNLKDTHLACCPTSGSYPSWSRSPHGTNL